MKSCVAIFFGMLALGVGLGRAAEIDVHPSIQRALDRLYNFDFAGAHRVLDQHEQQDPGDPIGPAVRSAVYLFHELDRLMILESEFLADNKKITAKKKLKPDPVIGSKLLAALAKTQKLAAARLAVNPNDVNALFALCMKEGVLTDYKALVLKKQFRSLSNAKASNRYAVRLLKIEPNFYDAYLTTGVNEYLLGSLPFFVRWFVRMDQVKGSKKRAFRNLELVARKGKYLGPFAKILLAIMCLREKQPERSCQLLRELCARYPENPLMKKELAKLSRKLATGHYSN